MSLLLAAALASCEAPQPDDLDPVSLLVGAYDNAAQYEAADESLKIQPKIGDTRAWFDQQYAEFKVVDVPSVPGTVVALEWRKGGPGGEMSRQRFWAFQLDGPAALMYFYGFKSDVDMANEAALSALTRDDLIAYGDACALPVVSISGGYQLSIPETCRIVTQSGLDMILSSTITIREDTLTYEESGRLPDGTQIFEVPGKMAYVFEKRR
ncbi:MAG: hypothetical protein AAF221_09155 [Pseudomonadota bacterium]